MAQKAGNSQINGVGTTHAHENPHVKQIYELLYNGSGVGTVTLRHDLPRHGSLEPNNVVCTLLELYQSIPCDIPLIKTHSIAGWVFLNEVEVGNLIVWAKKDMHLMPSHSDLPLQQGQIVLLGGMNYSQWSGLEDVGIVANLSEPATENIIPLALEKNVVGSIDGHHSQSCSGTIASCTKFDSRMPSIIESHTPEEIKDYVQRIYAFQERIGIVCIKTKDYKGKVTRIDFGCEYYGTRAAKSESPADSFVSDLTFKGVESHGTHPAHHLGTGTRRCSFFLRYRYQSSKNTYHYDTGSSTLTHDHGHVDVWNYNTNKRLLIKQYKQQLIHMMSSKENISSGDIIRMLINEASKDDLYKDYFSTNNRKKLFTKMMRKNCEYFRRSCMDKRNCD